MSPAPVQLGLAAALGRPEAAQVELQNVSLDLLDGTISKPDPGRYDEKGWTLFVQSVQARGLDQAILVRPKGDRFEIVEGRHRVLAHMQLRLVLIPAQVRRDYTDAGAAVATLVTNLQRRRDTPLGEARHLAHAMQTGKLTATKVAEQAGLAQTTVRARLRLLELPEKLAARVGLDLAYEDLEPCFDLLAIPDKVPNRQALIARGLAAAASCKADGYNRVHRLRTAILDSLTEGKDAPGLLVDFQFADWDVRNDKEFQAAFAKLPGFKLGKHGDFVILDAKSATEARDAAEARIEARRKASNGAKAKTPEDREARVLRAARGLQLEQMLKHLQSRPSFNDELVKATYREVLERSGRAANSKAEKEALAMLTPATKATGRKLVDALWTKDRLALDRFVAAVVFLRNQDWHGKVVTDDDVCKLTTGQAWVAHKAAATRVVAARDVKTGKSRKGGK
jgi:ParB/RepB/Spo0J family partition protein